jgi:hypothetical protein
MKFRAPSAPPLWFQHLPHALLFLLPPPQSMVLEPLLLSPPLLLLLQSVSLPLLLEHLSAPRARPRRCRERQSASTSHRGRGRRSASSLASALFFLLHVSTGARVETVTPARSTSTASGGGKWHRCECYRPSEAVGTRGQAEGGGHASDGAVSTRIH